MLFTVRVETREVGSGILAVIDDLAHASGGQLAPDFRDDIHLPIVLARGPDVEDIAGDHIRRGVDHHTHRACSVPHMDIRPPELLSEHLKPPDRTAYMACVRRTTRRGKAEVYPMPLWERLPAVKVPLRADDADVPLDLQALVEQCYRNGGYEGTLNYAADPDPPLLDADQEWAAQRLHESGLRPARKPRRKGKGKSRPK